MNPTCVQLVTLSRMFIESTVSVMIGWSSQVTSPVSSHTSSPKVFSTPSFL